MKTILRLLALLAAVVFLGAVTYCIQIAYVNSLGGSLSGWKLILNGNEIAWWIPGTWAIIGVLLCVVALGIAAEWVLCRPQQLPLRKLPKEELEAIAGMVEKVLENRGFLETQVPSEE